MDIKYWLRFLSEWLGVIAVIMIAGASPLLKKMRPIDFRYQRREATFALTLFAVSLLIAFQFFANPIFEFARTFAANFKGGDTSERMVLGVACLVLFILAMVIRGQPLKSIGWGKANLKAGAIVGLLLVALVILLRGKFAVLIKGVTPEQGQLLLVWFLLAAAEETIFRGYIQLRLNSFLGTTWGWLATALLFMLWQLPGRLGVLSFAEMWPTLLIALAQSLLLGWIMRKSGHVLAPILYRVASTWILLI